MLNVKPVGKRPEYFNRNEFDAFSVLHQPLEGDAWPQGPVFPEGHILTLGDGVKYEVIVPETIQTEDPGVPGGFRYTHRYICRIADEGGL